MEWGREQEAALRSVSRWLNDSDQQVFRLFGFAGTGKTTLARHFAEGVEGTVLFGAYTGKAAHVLRSKGCASAMTIHSMIYKSREKSKIRLRELENKMIDLKFEFEKEHPRPEDAAVNFALLNDPRYKELRKEIEKEREAQARPLFAVNQDSIVKGASLVVIDECSMVDGNMGEDLLSFGKKVLVLGDPAQLPPIGSAGFFTEGVKPDVMLTDIHRQAVDNPIIAMATRVRNKEALDIGSYGSSRVIEKDQVTPEMPMSADQILVGRNATRTASNRRVRALLGREGIMPVEGDRLVCLRNNNEKGLLNGAIWFAQEVEEVNSDRCLLTAKSEADGVVLETEAHSHYFQGRGDQLPWYEKKESEEFDYGYALTVHKAQGSQWDKVFLFDESYAFRQDKWRWLYTGLTRAAEEITIVRM